MPGHSRTRLLEADVDAQVIELIRKLRIPDDNVRTWFRDVLRAKVHEDVQADQERIVDLNRQLSSLRDQRERLLNLRLQDEIDKSTYSAKNTELADRIAQLAFEIEGCTSRRSGMSALAEKVFELSQTLEDKWLVATTAEKRRLLRILYLNFTLVDATLVPAMRKPFDVLAKGLFVSPSRGDRI